MRDLSLGDCILTVLGKIWTSLWSKYKDIVILVGLTFIVFFVLSGSMDVAIQWAKIMWDIIGIATMNAGKLILNKILQDIV